jgi:ribosomal protein S14
MSKQKWHAMPGDLPSYFRIFNLSRCSLREKSADMSEMTGFIKPLLGK